MTMPSPSGRSDERVRLDGELGDHRELVGSFDDGGHVGIGGRGVHVAPAVAVLAQDVRAGQWVVGADGRVLDERRTRRQRRVQGDDRGQRLTPHPHEGGRRFGRVRRLGRDGRDRFPVVVGLADGEDRPIAELRAEARDRLREIGRRQDGPDTRHGQRLGHVDGVDAGAGMVDRDESHVELAVEVDVGHVGLPADDPIEAAATGRRRADGPGHRSVPSAAAEAAAARWTASKICS